ncbi:MAG TPA: DSD1 family PLP-dependent enzyme [Gammaproteobacteria bacterium]|nr:DSD1 family PLP-dependent enzyme [Gammaproteobacteria bacterium]
MVTRPPAEIGMLLDEVDTPALLVDLDAFERNLELMAANAEAAGVRLRPHAKTHKCAVIARRQIMLGAVGVCCQKVSEAEALVHAGVPDVLISNEVVGRRKLERLAALAKQAQVAVCVDDAANVGDVDAAAAKFDTVIDVLVEVNVGANRCGVAPGDAVLNLAKRVDAAGHLRFTGLQAYQGRAQHMRDFEQRRTAIDAACASTRQTVELLQRNDLECEVIAGAGTGTWALEAESGLYNELQVGSYVFMDADYARNRNPDGGRFDEFEHSLFVYATVMSLPEPTRAVVDAGLKSMAFDSGMPEVVGSETMRYAGASDEHGNLDLSQSNTRIALGDKLRLIPGHCDPTVNLYDWYVCVRGNRVEALWPIVARGAVW